MLFDTLMGYVGISNEYQFSHFMENLTTLLLFVGVGAIGYKIVKSKLAKWKKVIITLILLLLIMPSWYIGVIVGHKLVATVVPQSKLISCDMLNLSQCELRPDCELFPVLTGIVNMQDCSDRLNWGTRK